MNGMCPIKKRYLLLLVPIMVVVIVCIYRTDKKYPDIVEYNYGIGDELEYKDMLITVKDVQTGGKEYMESMYADDPIVMNIYENMYKDDNIVVATMNVENINKELFMEIVNNWHIAVGTQGNGVAYMTDCANGEFADEKIDKEITVFFKVPKEWLEESNNEIKIMTTLYPKQHNIYVDLDE